MSLISLFGSGFEHPGSYRRFSTGTKAGRLTPPSLCPLIGGISIRNGLWSVRRGGTARGGRSIIQLNFTWINQLYGRDEYRIWGSLWPEALPELAEKFHGWVKAWWKRFPWLAFSDNSQLRLCCTAEMLDEELTLTYLTWSCYFACQILPSLLIVIQ